MKKTELIEKLEDALKDKSNEEKESIKEYYDELVSDAVEDGKDEEKFIDELGSIDEIIKKEDMESKVKKAEENPSVKNSSNAIFAILGVAASPILIPIAIAILAVIFALFISGVAVAFSLAVTVLALVIALVASFIGIFIYSPIVGYIILPIIGSILIITGLTIILSKFIFHTAPKAVLKLFKRVFKKEVK